MEIYVKDTGHLTETKCRKCSGLRSGLNWGPNDWQPKSFFLVAHISLSASGPFPPYLKSGFLCFSIDMVKKDHSSPSPACLLKASPQHPWVREEGWLAGLGQVSTLPPWRSCLQAPLLRQGLWEMGRPQRKLSGWTVTQKVFSVWHWRSRLVK